MSTARGQLASSLLILAAWLAAAWVLVKYFVPAIRKALPGSGGGSGYGTPLTVSTVPGLVERFPDNASITAGLYNQKRGYNYDGSQLTQAERDVLTPKYDSGPDAAANGSTYALKPYDALPSSAYVTQDADNYLRDATDANGNAIVYADGSGAAGSFLALNGDGGDGGGDLQDPTSPDDVASWVGSGTNDWWA